MPLNLYKTSKWFFQGLIRGIYRIIILRKKIKQSFPDIIISFGDKTNILTIISKSGLRVPCIISERIDPSHYKIGRVWNILRNKLYRYSDCLVVQTESIKAWFLQYIKFKKSIVIIPNPVSINDRNETETVKGILLNNKSKIIVSMGRLVWEKGFDLLIESYSRIQKIFPDWKLLIFGDGVEKENLRSKVISMGLENNVLFGGVIKNPISILKRADLFILPSRVEGFPNALLEAMACGLPVISFNCPSGPSEIIKNGTNGILVPPENVEELTYAIENMIRDHKKRIMCGNNAKEVIKRYDQRKIVNVWKDLINKVISEKTIIA